LIVFVFVERRKREKYIQFFIPLLENPPLEKVEPNPLQHWAPYLYHCFCSTFLKSGFGSTFLKGGFTESHKSQLFLFPIDC